MKRQPTVADIVMVVGGVVTFIFSFLDFFEGVERLVRRGCSR